MTCEGEEWMWIKALAVPFQIEDKQNIPLSDVFLWKYCMIIR